MNGYPTEEKGEVYRDQLSDIIRQARRERYELAKTARDFQRVAVVHSDPND